MERPQKMAKVNNMAPAEVQITAKQLLREAKERDLEIQTQRQQQPQQQQQKLQEPPFLTATTPSPTTNPILAKISMMNVTVGHLSSAQPVTVSVTSTAVTPSPGQLVTLSSASTPTKETPSKTATLVPIGSTVMPASVPTQDRSETPKSSRPDNVSSSAEASCSTGEALPNEEATEALRGGPEGCRPSAHHIRIRAGPPAQGPNPELFNSYTIHDKKYDNRDGIEDVIVSKRKYQYEQEVAENPLLAPHRGGGQARPDPRDVRAGGFECTAYEKNWRRYQSVNQLRAVRGAGG
ncbi:hypothetical protein KR200_011927 [Drosophila serrata]|nr:hypothetical protein KR200_011927 [Drosophila serrata]